MKPQDVIAQLEKEKAALEEQVSGLKKRVTELEAAKPKSKSREQAEKGLEMLKQGPVALAQFATLNPKYPGDVAYYIRNMMKIDVKTARTAGGTLYMLPEQFAVYQDGLKKEKEQKKASEAEAKETIQQAQIAPSPTAGAVVAAAL
jgi:hypothetical protein